ncbi:hypothetical protein [Ferruginibacter sp. HRS2-29]|uniref:hypothetical protein n=1 Tax=Ferruginibacter sp. HRS2-29 TaxID=2487334 RepID=UPI0020CC368B|nr:hypothetical protein [Ferruginibacter sp. HRS2-29]MCP9749614.1 hypothetical protein [Ferruginibacter sp. HRS2-29]
MSETIQQGKISFINHEKKYAIIEYMNAGKKKNVNGSIDEKQQQKLKEKGLIRKKHHFLVGDVVNFKIKLSDRGDRMIATEMEYKYNTALDVLIDKSRTSNKFIGYLKMVDDKYFVKEIDSYLFFPVPYSPWQLPPTEKELNEQVTFALENTEKKEKITASLFNNAYIPEFNTAVKLSKSKEPVEAEVFKVSPHGVYLNVVADKIQAKMKPEELPDAKPGDKVMVRITYLSKSKIAVEKT